MNIDITPLIQAVIGICAALITYRLIPYIKSKTTTNQWSVIKTAANTAANAAQALDKSGSEKKAAAVDTVNRALESAGLKVDTSVVEDSVEAAYQTIKKGASNG